MKNVLGSIQLLPAVSMHPIKVEENQITTTFKSKESKKHSTMGIKQYVLYGLYSTTGIYSPYRGKQNNVTSHNLAKFDEAIVNFPYLRTGTKVYCQPALYLRVLRNRYGAIKNYKDYIKVSTENTLNDDVNIDISDFVNKLKEDKDIVEIRGYIANNFKEKFEQLNKSIMVNSIDDWKENDNELISEYVLILEVVRSNPNGDPRDSNAQITISGTDIGLITDDCIKRWARDYWELVRKEPIFVSRTSELREN